MSSRFPNRRGTPHKKNSESGVQLLNGSCSTSSSLSSPSCDSGTSNTRFTYTGCGDRGSRYSEGNDEGVFCSESETDVKFVLSPLESQQQQQNIQQQKQQHLQQRKKSQPFEGYTNIPEKLTHLTASPPDVRASVRSASTVVFSDHGSAAYPPGSEHGPIVSVDQSSAALPPGSEHETDLKRFTEHYFTMYSTPGDPKTMIPRRKFPVLPRIPPEDRSNEKPPRLPKRPKHLSLPLKHQHRGQKEPKLPDIYNEDDNNSSLLVPPERQANREETLLKTALCSNCERQNIPRRSSPTSPNGRGIQQPFHPRNEIPLPTPPHPQRDCPNDYEIQLPLPPHRQGRRSGLKHRCVRRRCLVVMTIVSLVVAAASAVALIVFLISDQRSINDLHLGGQASCIPCQLFNGFDNQNHMNALSVKQVQGSGEKMCCFQSTNSTQVAALVYLLINKQNETVPETSAPGKPGKCQASASLPVVAHKHLLPPPEDKDKPPSSEGQTKLIFNASSDRRTEYTRGVDVSKYSLVILYSGWYFIHSSVNFNVDLRETDNCNGLTYSTWKYYVQQKRGSSDTTLLTGVTHCCTDCSYHSTTSYTGGMFCLQKSDQLYVQITGSGLVVDDMTSSFLGLALMSDKPDGNCPK